jgi:hypothetical protein
LSLVEASQQAQPDHPSQMALAEANQQAQPDHPSWMPLAEANHDTQQPSRMLLVEASQ